MGHVVTIAASTTGFDTDTVVPGAFAACNYGSGYSYVGRYISLTSPEHSGDLSSVEATQITKNGHAVLVVQHPRREPTPATALRRRKVPSIT